MAYSESRFSNAALLFTAAALTCAALAAHADASADEAVPGRGDTLEEIVITAQKRSEDLQKVPISATVLDTAALREKNVISLNDLTSVAPSLSIVPQTTGESYFNIRGVGVQATSPSSSNGVAFYVDSSYIPDNFTNLFSLYDIASVQVLRGPQGTLVGENATGGAILVSSVQPLIGGSAAGYYQQTVGDYHDFREEGAINLPISDTLAARVAFVSETRDSWTHNLGGGQLGPNSENQPGDVNVQAVRLQGLWRPTDQFEATLRIERFQSNTDGPAVKPLAVAATDPFSASIQNQPYTIAYDTPQEFDVVGDRFNLEMKYDITSGIQLRSITSSQDGHETDHDDFDFGRDVGDVQLRRRTDVRTFTQELNLLSTGSGPLQWVGGLYYLDTSTPLELSFTSTPNFTPPSISLFTSPYGISKHFNEAAFGQITYAFSSSWSATLGGRYTIDRLPYDATSDLGPAVVVTDTEARSRKPMGKAAIDWNATANTMLYVSIANGYKAGGGNLVGAPYGPEDNVVTELGTKTTLFDSHLRINADVFNSNYSAIQLQQFVGGAPSTVNAASAKIRGGEAEVTAAFGAFRADGGASFLHGYFSEPFTYVTTPIGEGTVTPYTPRWQANAGVQYRQTLPLGSLTPRLQYTYATGQTTLPTTPTALSYLPQHAIGDALLTYEAPTNWRIQVYCTNIANRVYVANTVDAGIGPGGFLYDAPRQYGLRVNYSFGSSAN